MMLRSRLSRSCVAASRASVLRRALATQRFPVPTMGDSITEGTLLELSKRVGDFIAIEEQLASVETDKVTVEVKSPASGTITALFYAPDDNVIVGTDFVEIDVGVGEAGASAPATPAAPASAPPAAAAPAAAAVTAASPEGAVRIHPSGRPSLMAFPKRGAARAAARAAAAFTPGATTATTATSAALQPRFGDAAAAPGAVSYTQLPARFKRPPISEEEMEAVDSGGASVVW